MHAKFHKQHTTSQDACCLPTLCRLCLLSAISLAQAQFAHACNDHCHAGAELALSAWAQRSELEPACQLSLLATIKAAGVAVDVSAAQSLSLVHVGGLTLKLDEIQTAQLVDILPAEKPSAS